MVLIQWHPATATVHVTPCRLCIHVRWFLHEAWPKIWGKCEQCKLGSFTLLNNLEFSASLLHQSQLFQPFVVQGMGFHQTVVQIRSPAMNGPAPWIITNCTSLSSPHVLLRNENSHTSDNTLPLPLVNLLETRHNYFNKYVETLGNATGSCTHCTLCIKHKCVPTNCMWQAKL